MKLKLRSVAIFFGAIFLGVSLTIGAGAYRLSQAAPNYQYLDLFTKILHFVQTNYVDEVDTKKLMEGAIKGMLATLDPHTIYLSPELFKEMQVDTQGKFGGLGIEINVADGFLTVVTPIEDTPAYLAGVEPGDRIVMIEDKAKNIKKETKNLSLQEAVNLMRGEKGTKVTIHVARKGAQGLKPIEITRDIIKVAAVKGGLLDKDYAWIRLVQFQSNTARDVKKKLEQLAKENGRPLVGAVIDLRNNPGGLLEEAINVSSLFLEKVPVVSTMGRSKAKKEVEFARGSAPFKNLKLVALVNEASASASEIVAGALQDNKRALVVGKPTFGKGSVQTVIDLENKSALKLTVARYYTPSGTSIQGKGITPDIEVDRIDMAVLEKARQGKFLKEADLENHLIGENEKKEEGSSEESGERAPKSEVGKSEKDQKTHDRLFGVIKEKDGKKVRVEDPKELLKIDFQLQQAMSYLKAWNLFEKVSQGTKEAKVSSASE
jgi:carboxyl-terminal processing protease